MAQVAPALKMLLFSTLLSAAQLACSFGLWSWKKWGAYGYGALSILICMASSKVDPQHHASLGSLVWLILMVAAVLPKWGSFED